MRRKTILRAGLLSLVLVMTGCGSSSVTGSSGESRPTESVGTSSDSSEDDEFFGEAVKSASEIAAQEADRKAKEEEEAAKAKITKSTTSESSQSTIGDIEEEPGKINSSSEDVDTVEPFELTGEAVERISEDNGWPQNELEAQQLVKDLEKLRKELGMEVKDENEDK